MAKLWLFLFVLGFLSCHTSKNIIPVKQSFSTEKAHLDSTIITQRKILKDYVLCKCILKSYEKENLIIYDISLSFYNELLLYGEDAIEKIDSFTNDYVNSIKPSTYLDYKGKKATIFLCTELYNSPKLDSIIIDLDSSIMK